MVDKLCGLTKRGPGRPYKFVHHLPICADVNIKEYRTAEEQSLLSERTGLTSQPSPNHSNVPFLHDLLNAGGGRLEELFFSSSHAKMYVAINTVAVAPCILGKSNMFRRSHLNYLTSPLTTNTLSSSNPATSETASSHSVGIDYFSHNICEDHLIADLLWRKSIPHEPHIGNHGLVLGDLAIQPLTRMSVMAYVARRVRWLRVRKFTVTLATLVEPGTESFLCSAYGAFALTTLPWFEQHGIPPTWIVFWVCWLFSIAIWASVDWTEYLLLQSGRTLRTGSDSDQSLPVFARPLNRLSRRPFIEWLFAWLGREALALPVWAWAFYGGVTVVWRDRSFWVGLDMRVHEIVPEQGQRVTGGNVDGGGGAGGNVTRGKARID
jgi:ceramide glucosyltransferase